MAALTRSPLSMLIDQGLEALGACQVDPAPRRPAGTPSETIEQIAGGLLVAMGMGEIAEDLDLQGLALLGAASVAGLQKIALEEPGIHDTAGALHVLECLMRRTAPGGKQPWR